MDIWSFAILDLFIAWDKGEWERAFAAADRALSVHPEAPAVLAVAASLCLETGDDARLEPYRDRLAAVLEAGSPDADLDTVVEWLGRAAWVTAREDVFDLAIRAAADPRDLPAEPVQSGIWRGEAWRALARDDARAIGRKHAELDAYRKSPETRAMEGRPTDQLLLCALLEARAGDPGLALRMFDSALAVQRHVRYLPRVAWLLAEHAEVLLRRAHGDDRARAVKSEEEALTIARDLGMRPLIRRIVRRRRP